MAWLLFIYGAFLIWMLIDAYQKRMESKWYIIILIPLGAFYYFYKHKMDEINIPVGGSAPSGLPCSSCRYKITIYDDRIKCGYKDPPIMKTYVNASYCMNYMQK